MEINKPTIVAIVSVLVGMFTYLIFVAATAGSVTEKVNSIDKQVEKLSDDVNINSKTIPVINERLNSIDKNIEEIKKKLDNVPDKKQ